MRTSCKRSDDHKPHTDLDHAEPSVYPDIAALIDTPTDRLIEAIAPYHLDPALLAAVERWHLKEIGGWDARAWALRLHCIMEKIIASTHPQLAVIGLAYAIGSCIVEGRSMREAARAIGVSPFTLGKIAGQWTRDLDLRRSAYQWPEHTMRHYRAVRSAGVVKGQAAQPSSTISKGRGK